MAVFLYYLGAAAVVPGRAFKRLEREPKKFRKGFRVMIMIGLLFAISAAGLAAAGALLPAPAFLPLPSHNYYFYEMFFALPVFVAAWLIGAAAGLVFSLLLGGWGSFKAAAAAWAFAFAVPAFLMWLPHALFSGFLTLGMSQKEFMSYTAYPGLWRTAFFAYQVLALFLLLLGSTRAAQVARDLKPIPAVITGFFAAGVFAWVIGFVIR